MVLTEGQKIGHVLRRLGLGASPWELEEYGKLGLEGTLRRLIDGPFPKDRLDPVRFFMEPKEDARPETYRLRSYWMMELLTTHAPLREKMALFWHDHFAVDEDGGGDGLMMLDYLRLLRKDPLGSFPQLLLSMAQNPSFMEMLTMNDSTRAKPNENFARELFELYTLGEGNYTEADIKEAARCFTGWTFANRYWRFSATHSTKLQMMQESGMGYSGFCFVGEFFDEGEKQILGTKGRWTGEELIARVAMLPRCAEFLCTKLWEYFAYEAPERVVVEHLSREYLKTNGSIRAVIWAIVRRPEFWSEKAMRTRVKSPIEFCTAIARAMGSAQVLPEWVEMEAPWSEPIPLKAWESVGGIGWNAFQQGQELLRPPSVAGWDWGKAWINSNSMLWRMKFGGFASWEPKDPERKKWGAGAGGRVMLEFVKSRQPKSIDALAGVILRLFDAALSGEAYEAFKGNLERRGGMQPIESGNDEWLFGQIWGAYELLRAAPEFHYC